LEQVNKNILISHKTLHGHLHKFHKLLHTLLPVTYQYFHFATFLLNWLVWLDWR